MLRRRDVYGTPPPVLHLYDVVTSAAAHGRTAPRRRQPTVASATYCDIRRTDSMEHQASLLFFCYKHYKNKLWQLQDYTT